MTEKGVNLVWWLNRALLNTPRVRLPGFECED